MKSSEQKVADDMKDEGVVDSEGGTAGSESEP